VQIDVLSDEGFCDVQAEPFHLFSPLQFFVGDSAPAFSADGQSYTFEVDVDFDVVVFAVFVPRVFATFHSTMPPVND
jgi:hypothetical protein